jgi:hypothetical protein
MNAVLKSFFPIILFFLFATSCKKKDNNPAEIIITSPYSGAVFTAGDTIPVAATLTDDGALGNLSIKLLNSSYTPVDHQQQLALNDLTSYNLNEYYIIDNLFLESGNYYIGITVSDGNEDANEYRSIVIHALPKIRKDVYFLTRPDTINVNVVELDSIGQLITRFNIPGDYAESAMNSRWNELMVCGYRYGYFNQFDLENYTTISSEPAYNGSGPSFQDIFFYNNLTFVSYYDGRIRAFDRLGAVKYNSAQPVAYQPGTLCANSKYVFAEAFYPGSGERKLVVINYPSGIVRDENNLGASVSSIISTAENEIMIFGNSNGDGKIFSYHVLDNDADDLHTLPGVTIYGAVAIDSDNYAVATENGLYSYQVSINNLIPMDLNRPCYAIEYDEVNGILFAASGKEVRQYAFPTPQVLSTVVCQDSVLDIRLLFNK